MGHRVPRVVLGDPQRGLSDAQRGSGVPRGAQGIPRELGFPEARDPLAAWMGWLGWLGSMESPMGYLKSVWGLVLG